jgi:hypothetical protein
MMRLPSRRGFEDVDFWGMRPGHCLNGTDDDEGGCYAAELSEASATASPTCGNGGQWRSPGT